MLYIKFLCLKLFRSLAQIKKILKSVSLQSQNAPFSYYNNLQMPVLNSPHCTCLFSDSFPKPSISNFQRIIYTCI
jgi:hypothetical protein